MPRKKIKESFISNVFESKLFKEFEDVSKNSKGAVELQLENSNSNKADLKGKNTKGGKKDRSNNTRLMAPKTYTEQRKSKKAWHLLRLPYKNLKIRFVRSSFMSEEKKKSENLHLINNDCIKEENLHFINNAYIKDENDCIKDDINLIKEENAYTKDDINLKEDEKNSNFIKEEDNVRLKEINLKQEVHVCIKEEEITNFIKQ